MIPNGFDSPINVPMRKVANPPRVGFIGVMDWHPNVDGIRWFADRCWPLVKREIPDARLRLVGRESDGPLCPDGPDIDALGWVEDAAAEIATWAVMIVPVRLGSGTRGKIAHAFSLKCPIVSTTLGSYGYDVVDGRELLLAESPEDLASACVRAIQKPVQAAAMAEMAWERFIKTWTWDAIRPRVWAAAEDCLRLARNRRP